MKRSIFILTLLLAVAVFSIAPVMAQNIPAPKFCGCLCRGFTPGFWKHNIQVYLDLTNGAYSAFEGGPKDGIKLTDAMMDGFLAAIKAKPGMSGFTFEQALAYLKLPGWSADRTNTANWFNWAAGYGPFVG